MSPNAYLITRYCTENGQYQLTINDIIRNTINNNNILNEKKSISLYQIHQLQITFEQS